MNKSPMIDSVLDIFTRQAKEDFLFEIPTGRVHKYGEFQTLAFKAAGLLQSNGVGHGDRFALAMANSTEFAAFFLGGLFLGAVVVPVNLNLHSTEIDFILTNSKVETCVFSLCSRPQILSAPSSAHIQQICIMLAQELSFHPDERGLMLLENHPDPRKSAWCAFDRNDDDLLTLGFTSGTTGLPKGVGHRVGALLSNADNFNRWMGFGPATRFINVWPMSYSSGFLNNMLCSLMAGGSLVMSKEFDAQTVLQFWKPVIEHKVNTIWLSPSMMAALTRIDRDPKGLVYCRELKVAFCVGTAPLPLKAKKEFELKYGVSVYESYGLSELLLVAGNTPFHRQREGAVGRLLPGVEVCLNDSEGHPVATDQEGEIAVATPWLMAGYLDYQSGHLVPVQKNSGGFPTGDIGRLDADGYLYITARKKDLIIRGGFNISPKQIEDVLETYPVIKRAAAVGVPHDFYGEEIVAFLMLADGARLNDEQIHILEHCKKHLNRMAVPNRLVVVSEFPLTSTGKIQKYKLKESLDKSNMNIRCVNNPNNQSPNDSRI